jgi:hypothetical protein
MKGRAVANAEVSVDVTMSPAVEVILRVVEAETKRPIAGATIELAEPLGESFSS